MAILNCTKGVSSGCNPRVLIKVSTVVESQV